MIRNKSTLKVNRFIVYTLNGEIAYDQNFHSGVNIIRGNNSSGKSTIINLLFYALGGDFSNWNKASLKCKGVIVEVEINAITITLKRYINNNKNQPMFIYWGSIEDALSLEKGWKVFPYKQTDNRRSFTNVLFDILQYPEIKEDIYTNANITMHQILRLMFVDQESKTSDLFRSEVFDMPLTREATAELLLGLYDDELYDLRLNKKDLNKEKEQLEIELHAYTKLCKSLDEEIDLKIINDKINFFEEELHNREEKIKQIQSKIVYVQDNSQQNEIKEKISKLQENKKSLVSYISEYKKISEDIIDSNFFIESLKNRMIELDNSIITRDSLGTLPLLYCPQCLSPLEPVKDENICSLCHQPLPKDKDLSAANRIKQEIELQIKESLKTIDNKKKKKEECYATIKKLEEIISSIQKDIDLKVHNSKPTTNIQLDNLYEDRGALKEQISQLKKQLLIVDRYDKMKNKYENIIKDLKKIAEKISDKEEESIAKRTKAINQIQYFTAYILKNDLARQKEFVNASPRDVGIDFKSNSMQLQGSFNFSASSNIYLKNSIRFAIFFSSIINDTFRYPRFIVCDNIEDKGMEQERSYNFQRILVRMSEKLKNEDFQMIISTSMINPNLNTNEYCIGPEYTAENKSLQL